MSDQILLYVMLDCSIEQERARGDHKYYSCESQLDNPGRYWQTDQIQGRYLGIVFLAIQAPKTI